jgi:O-antigen/teichoic acid export membrane protein
MARPALPGRLSEDHLVRNALFLLISTGTMGIFGFVFWIIAAHLYSSTSIGRAATVISAVSVIAYMSDLGLASTLIRVLPTSEDADAEINTALILTTALALMIATGYVIVVPLLVPNVAFLRHDPLDAVGFVLLNGCASANLLTDSVFIARRHTGYNILADGAIQGVVKLGCLGGFVGLAAYGIFASSGIGGAVALVASLIFMVWRVDYHPKLRIDFAVFVRTLRFSLSSYVGNIFQLLPLLFLPIIVVNGEGTSKAAAFFIAFNLANLTYAVSFAMCASLFAEGSQGVMDTRALARRASKLLMPVTLGLAVIVAVTAHWILLIYGADYSRNATSSLLILVAALPIVALNNMAQILLKLRNRLSMVMIVNVASFIVILGLAELWSLRSIAWVALAWLLGNLVAALLAWGGWLFPRPQHAGPSYRGHFRKALPDDQRPH